MRLFILLSALFWILPSLVIAADSELSVKLESVERRHEMDRRWMVGLGTEARMGKQISSDVDYENETFQSAFIGYREKWFQTLNEIAVHEKRNSTGVLDIATERREFRQWARAMLYPEKSWSPFLGVSLGLYEERIQSRFNGDQRNSKTDFNPTAGLEAGLHATIFERMYTGLNFRALQDFPEGFDTGSDSWNWSVQFQLGFSPF